ncbi:hypothetical protein BDN71DRAFT_1436524 [Pleurotus eryngii]|uniref:Uncharacterized protein n=1 Tax=Pleurotus eryngii TaxID=5323 RepID=A0A9P5ZGY2_PLEER|nr:hypothetical protein BDN71DRAFT_1436524 [Pleurotus eryngii]
MASKVVVSADEESELAEIAYEKTCLNRQIQGDLSTVTLGVAIAVTSHLNAVGIGRDKTTWLLLALTVKGAGRMLKGQLEEVGGEKDIFLNTHLPLTQPVQEYFHTPLNTVDDKSETSMARVMRQVRRMSEMAGTEMAMDAEFKYRMEKVGGG